MTRRLAQLVLTCSFGVLLAALPGPASATSIAGPNGKIVFASGRASKGIPMPSAGDADARIWVADGPTATPVQVTTLPAGMQHRHPNWSPDHSKIAYAAGTAFSPTSHYAIWIADLKTGDQTEFVPAADGQDRPTWSPDGTKIAYGSGGNIFVKDIAPGSQPVQITIGTTDQRPVWSPDGKTLYFNRGAAGNRDIYRVTPVSPDGTVTGLLTDATDDWQPAVSPDGQRLCFLRGPQSDMADLYTVNVNGTGASPFSTTTNVGDLNCVWSPNGASVLFTLGAFTGGDLELRDKNGNNPDLLTNLNVAAHFDGNADWATNFSPKCANKTIPQVAVNGFTSITLGCTDPDAGLGAEPPTPTPLGGDELSIASPPSHGNIGGALRRRQADLHAEQELPRHRHLHLHGQRRRLRLGAGHGDDQRGHRGGWWQGRDRPAGGGTEAVVEALAARARPAPPRARGRGHHDLVPAQRAGHGQAQLPARDPRPAQRAQVREDHAAQPHQALLHSLRERGEHHRPAREGGAQQGAFPGPPEPLAAPRAR